MAGPTVVLISGVSQGIGKALAQTYLLRPNYTVIGSVRNTASAGVAELKASPKGQGSKLIFIHIENTSPEDPKKAAEEVKAQGIDHVDIIIANAGGSPPVVPLDEVGQDDMITAFRTNVCGPLALFQAFKPLLQKSEKPKWVSISSVGSSLAIMPQMRTDLTPAYGTSKAALNWITLAFYCANEWLTTLHIHPGLVQTGPGNWVAQQIGLEKAPYTIEHSVERITSLVDEATREKSSGKLINAPEGTDMPW
ncbi:hypothetical protein GGS23DRAFT_181540 [Durotheca rogersii]|uniref:uncharacterized protein n=1 Tax=Durotheca rogersii TaxID=419775 RepID=UPI00221E3A03|nr:uncharacterized protein GGS23DRAFT_181540 [Durotheca rogersii]KAI5867515.1 hypothetical protein GGS23DRAFT_181540 [Durotheca rogersii]